MRISKKKKKNETLSSQEHIRDQNICKECHTTTSNADLCVVRLGISHQLNVVLEFKSGLGVVLPGDKVHYQRVLDCEDRVVVKILVLAVEDLGGQRAVAFFGSLFEYISLEITSKG